MYRISNLPALDPKTAGTARIVAGDVIDALAEQFGNGAVDGKIQAHIVTVC